MATAGTSSSGAMETSVSLPSSTAPESEAEWSDEMEELELTLVDREDMVEEGCNCAWAAYKLHFVNNRFFRHVCVNKFKERSHDR